MEIGGVGGSTEEVEWRQHGDRGSGGSMEEVE